MPDKARDIHFALFLSCLGKIKRSLHPQPHVGAAAESLFKAQHQLRRDGASTLHHVVSCWRVIFIVFAASATLRLSSSRFALASAPG
jgi:anti-sigma-K factor RskA